MLSRALQTVNLSILATLGGITIYTGVSLVRYYIRRNKVSEPIYIIPNNPLSSDDPRFDSGGGVMIPRHVWWGFLDYLIDNNVQTAYGLYKFRNLSRTSFKVHINYYDIHLQSYLIDKSINYYPFSLEDLNHN
jgi:hypothetical protein